MLRIGLTGGIGSGKSTVAKMFQELEIDIIDADVIARNLTAKNSPLLTLIQNHFGSTILKADGLLNRELLRELIFKNAEDKSWLENLIHPKVRESILEAIFQVTSPYCIIVIPLLIESIDSIKFIDRICVVDASEDIQMERTSQRDQVSKEQVNSIINQQSSRQKRLAYADDIILNDYNLESLQEKVAALHQLYLQLASGKL